MYAKVSRHELDGLLRLFDFPDANVTADKRVVTTVPQQQLFALNSAFMATQAQAFAARVEKLGKTDAERVTAAYRLAFGRPPEARELELAERFLIIAETKVVNVDQAGLALDFDAFAGHFVERDATDLHGGDHRRGLHQIANELSGGFV